MFCMPAGMRRVDHKNELSTWGFGEFVFTLFLADEISSATE